MDVSHLMKVMNGEAKNRGYERIIFWCTEDKQGFLDFFGKSFSDVPTHILYRWLGEIDGEINKLEYRKKNKDD